MAASGKLFSNIDKKLMWRINVFPRSSRLTELAVRPAEKSEEDPVRTIRTIASANT